MNRRWNSKTWDEASLIRYIRKRVKELLKSNEHIVVSDISTCYVDDAEMFVICNPMVKPSLRFEVFATISNSKNREFQFRVFNNHAETRLKLPTVYKGKTTEFQLEEGALDAFIIFVSASGFNMGVNAWDR